MEIEINLKWLRIKTDTTWRQIAIVAAFLVFLFGLVCVLNGVDREVALAVVGALGVLIGAFVYRTREDHSNRRSSNLSDKINGLLAWWWVGGICYIYGALVYLLSSM